MITYEDVVSYNTASEIVKIINDVYFGTSKEAVDFRVNNGSNGAVQKIIDVIVEKYMQVGSHK